MLSIGFHLYLTRQTDAILTYMTRRGKIFGGSLTLYMKTTFDNKSTKILNKKLELHATPKQPKTSSYSNQIVLQNKLKNKEGSATIEKKR